MNGFGELLPYHENKITLDKNKKDKWGLPILAMDAELKENELKMRKDIIKELMAMLDAAGVKNVTSWDKDYFMGQGIHGVAVPEENRGHPVSHGQYSLPQALSDPELISTRSAS